jgi:hypothetical protein
MLYTFGDVRRSVLDVQMYFWCSIEVRHSVSSCYEVGLVLSEFIRDFAKGFEVNSNIQERLWHSVIPYRQVVISAE